MINFKELKIKKLRKKIDKVKIDMLYLYKRGKDKDTINLLKQKATKLSKLHEELNKMKLEIKDGRLQPAAEKTEAPAPTPAELEERRLAREVEMEAIKKNEVEAMFKKKQAEAPEPRQHIPEFVTEQERPEVTQEVTPEDIASFREQEALRQEELMREQIMRERERSRMSPIQVPSREPVQQPVEEEEELPNTYKVRIILFPGTPVTIEIVEDDFTAFIDNIKEAINSQTTMYLGGNAVINGRYIIRYDVL